MTDRLARLEEKIEAIARELRAAEARIALLEGSTEGPVEPASAEPGATLPPVVAPAGTLEGRGTGVGGMLSIAGRTSLVLGGAFLIRALTETGALSKPVGVTLGLAYAATWLALAARDGRRGFALGAAFHGAASIVIGFPLLWEAAIRFSIFSPTAAILGVGLLAIAALFVASLQSTPALAWLATLGALATLFPFLAATARIEAVAGVFLLVMAATLWLAYSRHWPGPRWPAAFAADFGVVFLAAILTRQGGLPEAYRGTTIPGALSLSLALPLLCISSFSVRTLAKKREVTAFEMLQSAVSLLAGFGGAMAIAKSAGIGVNGLGMASLAVGLACYGVAFGFVARRDDSAVNFHFYSSLGLLMALAGSAFWLEARALVLLWGGLGIAGAILGGRYNRMTLRGHSATYAVAANLTGGLLSAAADAFVGPAGGAWRRPGTTGLLALGAAAASYGSLLVIRKELIPKWPRRIPAVILAAICLAGAGTLLLELVGGRPGAPFFARPGELAASRTAVLAGSALALAALGRRRKFWELSWFSYPLLALGGLKLLLEDLSRGRPITLFLGFVCYGVALIFVPKLLRERKTITRS
jgi:hypothetical protein